MTYLPFNGGGKDYTNELRHLADDLEVGESYAIVAFHAAASTCLEYHLKPQPKLAALICYYPTSVPSPKVSHPSTFDISGLICSPCSCHSQPTPQIFKSSSILQELNLLAILHLPLQRISSHILIRKHWLGSQSTIWRLTIKFLRGWLGRGRWKC